MQLGFYFDQTRCIGCFTCCVACKDWHDIPAGSAKWRRLSCLEEGKFPDVFVAYLTTACYHCAQPSCADACPVNAINKREEDGIVVVDRETCTACGLCLEACPYGSPQFSDEEDAKMQKCDLCLDRLREGKKPICVDACPTRALDSGTLAELEAKYGHSQQAAGFVYAPDIKPSVIFKTKAKFSKYKR